MRRPDAEIFRENVLRYKPMKMKLWELEESAGYAKGHLCSNVWKNCNVTVEHARNYARVLGVKPWKLTEGMFDEEHAEIFKRNIRVLCEEQDISLAEVMRRAGYNENHLHHLVGKHVEPSDEAIRCYAKALGVEPERLKEGFYDN